MIILVGSIAIIFYVVLPILFFRFFQKRRNRVVNRIVSLPCFSGTVHGIAHEFLQIETEKTPTVTLEEGILSLDPKKTQYFTVSLRGRLLPLGWRDLIGVKTGGTVMLYLPDPENKKTLCVFHEERNRAAYIAGIKKMDSTIKNISKPYCIATGVMLEFLLFLTAIHNPEMTAIAILALFGIFGKALPYCPPGILLTFLSHHISSRATREKKRSRQLGTVGIAVYAAGILLNIAVLFFIISSVGFGGSFI